MVKVVVNDTQGLVQSAGSGVSIENNLETSAVQASGLVTAGLGLTASTVGVEVSSGGMRIKGGHMVKKMEHTDANTQSHTFTAEQILKGILVNTTTTGAGVLTTATATQIVAGHGGEGALTTNNDCVTAYVINDGDQTTVVTGGTGVTVIGHPNIETNTGATLIFQRTGATAVKCYVVGGKT